MRDPAVPSYAVRAGRLIRQPAGYTAFVPAALPPDPSIDLGRLVPLLSSADQAIGRLDGVGLTLPNPDLFVAMYVRREAVLSSQIEGTQSTLDDVLAQAAHVKTFVLVGPSAGCVPDPLFARGVSTVGGAEVTDPDAFMDVCGALQPWGGTTKKYCIHRNASYPGFSALLERATRASR